MLHGKEGQIEHVVLGESEYCEYAFTAAVAIVCEYLIYHPAPYCKQLLQQLQQRQSILEFGEVLLSHSVQQVCQGLVLADCLKI